jgi:hypothetical protein
MTFGEKEDHGVMSKFATDYDRETCISPVSPVSEKSEGNDNNMARGAPDSKNDEDGLVSWDSKKDPSSATRQVTGNSSAADEERRAVEDNEPTGSDAGEYKLYKRRWFGLIALTFLNIIVSWNVSWPVLLLLFFRISSAAVSTQTMARGSCSSHNSIYTHRRRRRRRLNFGRGALRVGRGACMLQLGACPTQRSLFWARLSARTGALCRACYTLVDARGV